MSGPRDHGETGAAPKVVRRPFDAASAPPSEPPDDFFGSGEMGAVLRVFDWSQTPLGPIERWPSNLRTTVGIVMHSRFPMLLWWGPELRQIYNDAYRPVLGAKHPRSVGQPGAVVWSEIWDILGPRAEQVRSSSAGTWDEDLFLPMDRFGFTEETYFTFSYSAVPDTDVPGRAAGVLVTCTETTARVLGERRMRALRDLGARSSEAKTAEEACAVAAATVATNARDVPFIAIYLLDEDQRDGRLAGVGGLDAGSPAAPTVLSLAPERAGNSPWPAAAVAATHQACVVDDVRQRIGSLVAGDWPEPIRSAVILPIPAQSANRVAGIMIAGVSPRLRLEETYRGYLDVLAGQIGTAIANARSYEAERRRAEALAELDRAKSAFFSNVSHEFRTPLALMLGPVDELLARGELSARSRELLEVIHRNALRLHKLVNSLLDFSRIEAGRVQAQHEPVDLAEYTADLASSFRSAIEAEGLRLVVDCPPLGEPVHVDRDMWEKVVLNLLSNAFKHTFAGEITVRLHANAGKARLEVSDTGVGIPESALPHVFDRFHRVPQMRARTHEGSGIGLALVHELVRLHAGTVRVSSREGEGSTFTVEIPLGDAHLPPEKSAARSDTATRTATKDLARYWLPPASSGEPEAIPVRPPSESVGHVLLADDNADMRHYLGRLLREAGFTVEAVADGAAALAAMQARAPDLVLSDVMMPHVGGFELLRTIRSDPDMRTVPVILLSARAGEEARVEGLAAGADDYLVKPFNAVELIARITAHAQLASLRRAAYAEAEQARQQAEAANRAKSEFLAVMSHELRTPLNAIAGYVQLLQLEIHGPVTESQREALERIERSQRHLLRLINDLLNLARIEAGKVDYRIEDVPLHEVVATVTPMIEPQLREKQLRFTTDLAPGLTAQADREKVQQILLNVLTNAVKFTPAGGSIHIDAPKRVGTERFVFLRVSDTGIGIPRDKLDTIFAPFVQVDTSHTRQTSGSGLGLAISRDLARGMGGELRVRSVERAGSTFTLSLPASDVSPRRS